MRFDRASAEGSSEELLVPGLLRLIAEKSCLRASAVGDWGCLWSSKEGKTVASGSSRCSAVRSRVEATDAVRVEAKDELRVEAFELPRPPSEETLPARLPRPPRPPLRLPWMLRAGEPQARLSAIPQASTPAPARGGTPRSTQLPVVILSLLLPRSPLLGELGDVPGRE